MDDLTLLGLIFVIVGIVLAPFTSFFTLILALVGILLILAGERYTLPKYAPFPMYMQCVSCKCLVDVNSETCPYCENPTEQEALGSEA